MGNIVAIGGGDMANLETRAIDERVIELTGAAKPRALFVPTASYDRVSYWEDFRRVYRDTLGCETDVLFLLGVTPSREELEEKILSSHLVYVGGGNTLKMMRRWRRLGVDAILREAHDKGVVLAGLSAGCICWFSWGHSDSMAFYQPDGWSYVRVKGMGLIDALGCPHFDSATAGVPRKGDFERMVSRNRDVGIAIDNNCAIEVVDGGYRVITSQDGAGAYKLLSRSGAITTEPIEKSELYAPLAGLVSK